MLSSYLKRSFVNHDAWCFFSQTCNEVVASSKDCFIRNKKASPTLVAFNWTGDRERRW